MFEAKNLSAEEAKEIVQFTWIEGLLKFFKDEGDLVQTKMFVDMFIGNLDMDNANIEKKDEWIINLKLKIKLDKIIKINKWKLINKDIKN